MIFQDENASLLLLNILDKPCLAVWANPRFHVIKISYTCFGHVKTQIEQDNQRSFILDIYQFS